MIRHATKYDTKSIMEIWYQSFKGEKEFTDYFFNNLYDYKNSIVLEENGQVVSTLQRIPYYIENVGKVMYIYGACTLPEHRGNGYMKELLNVCEELDLKQKIKASILIPQSKSLFEFYKKFGYEPCFNLKKEKYNISQSNDDTEIVIAKKENADKIKKLYAEVLKGKNFVYRKENYIADQIEMFKSLGGEVFLLFEKHSLKGYAFVWNDKKPFIQELVCKEKCYENILSNKIMYYYNVNQIEVQTFSENSEIALGSGKFYDIQPCEIIANLLYN